MLFRSPVIGIFKKQKDNQEPLTIVGDGLQQRDFVNVLDVANANIIAMLANLADECYGEVYNIGSGENISILEIAQIMSNDYVHIPPREGEARTTLANIDKARTTFGWKPKIKIEEWIQNNG